MKLNLSREYEFIPKWNKNEQDEKPIKVICQYMTPVQKEKCFNISVMADGENPKVSFIPNREAFFTGAVKRIDNFENNGRQISTAKDFLKEPRLSDLFTEIVNTIIDKEGQGEAELGN